jgi:hypothetical protein
VVGPTALWGSTRRIDDGFVDKLHKQIEYHDVHQHVEDSTAEDLLSATDRHQIRATERIEYSRPPLFRPQPLQSRSSSHSFSRIHLVQGTVLKIEHDIDQC